MDNINKSRILSFEEFVAGGHDTEMDQMSMGGNEAPMGGDEIPSHEPVEPGMELMTTPDTNLDLMDEPEAKQSEETPEEESTEVEG